MKYTQHNFAFNQDGSFILSVDYVSYIDESMLSSNLLAGDTMLNLVYPNLKKRSKDEEQNNNHANLIVMQPSLPAKSIPSPPEVKPHEHILGPGGTQWIYN